jgi:hypothetical protein
MFYRLTCYTVERLQAAGTHATSTCPKHNYQRKYKDLWCLVLNIRKYKCIAIIPVHWRKTASKRNMRVFSLVSHLSQLTNMNTSKQIIVLSDKY